MVMYPMTSRDYTAGASEHWRSGGGCDKRAHATAEDDSIGEKVAVVLVGPTRTVKETLKAFCSKVTLHTLQ